MTKRVVVIASGETERNALPHLLAHLAEEGIIVNVLIPDRNQQLRPRVVRPLIYSALDDYENGPPDKIVVLVDTDGKSAGDALRPIRQNLQSIAIDQAPLGIHYAYAQWRLEACFFADDRNLRNYLGRNLGSVNPNQPDRIENPKQRLRNLLPGRIYTSEISEAIAETLNPDTISQRSPSFAGFLAAVRNGNGNGVAAR